jgi:hypothetical protein
MEQALNDLLATLAGGRNYWGRKPQNEPAKPFIIMQRISQPRDYHMQGPSRLVETRVQIDVYGSTWTSAANTAREVITILSGYRGGSISGIFIDGLRDLPAAAPGETSHLFRTSIDVMVHSKEN